MRRCSGKAKKIIYIIINTIRGTPRDIATKERKINNIKIKIIPFIYISVESRYLHPVCGSKLHFLNLDFNMFDACAN